MTIELYMILYRPGFYINYTICCSPHVEVSKYYPGAKNHI